MNKMPSRKNIRLKEYDYSNTGYYFITICTKNRQHFLSEIVNCRGEHCSSVFKSEGEIVKKYIQSMESIYSNIKIDEHVIRDELEYLKIKEYIINNPTNLEKDLYF